MAIKVSSFTKNDLYWRCFLGDLAKKKKKKKKKKLKLLLIDYHRATASAGNLNLTNRLDHVLINGNKVHLKDKFAFIYKWRLLKKFHYFKKLTSLKRNC